MRKVPSLSSWYYIAALVADFFNTALALAIALLIRFGLSAHYFTTEYFFTALFFMLGYYSISVSENLYSIRTTLNKPMLFYKILRTTVIVTFSFVLIIFVFKEFRYFFIESRMVIVLGMLLWIILSTVTKLFFLPSLFRSLCNRKSETDSTMLVTGNPSRNRSITVLLQKSLLHIASQRIVSMAESLPAEPDELIKTVFTQMKNHKSSVVVILFEQHHNFDCIAETCIALHSSNVPFVVYSPKVLNLGYFDPWYSLLDYGALTFLKRVKKPFEVHTTRICDVFFSLAALVVLSPVFLFTAIAVKLSSPGSVLFKQQRVGKDLATFTFLKFRSMREGTANTEAHRKYFEKYASGKLPEGKGQVFKLAQTSRVTLIGKIIRKTSIDELPQIFNVLVGDMAIVGPRPCIPYELEHYNNWQKRRFTVKPGLTGIWQVYGRSRLPFAEAQFLDFLYTIDSSHSLDFALVIKTIPVVLFGKGGL